MFRLMYITKRLEKTFKHISMVVLLLFLFAIGGRAVVSIMGCHCVEDIIEHRHHNCCGCDDHVDDCRYHTQSVDSNCASHRGGVDHADAITVEHRFSIEKRVILLISHLVQTPSLECVQSSYVWLDHRDDNVALRCLDWICDVGLLRAPPIC